MYEGVDRYSFRAAFLADAENLLGPELSERAYTKMSAAELETYGQALLEAAERFANERGLAQVAERREPYDDVESDEHRAHVVFAAARWCLYWARRGHGLEPWF